MDKNLKDQLDSANKLNATLKETRKSTTQLTKNFGSISSAVNNLRAESITSFREFNSGITQTINLFSRLSDLAKTRFKDIGTQINITTGVTQDLVGIIGEAVSATSENFELNSNIEESTKAVKKNLLENASVRAKINEAAKLEYENQEKYISGLDTAYNKKLREVRLKETESTNLDNLVKSLEEEVRLANDLLSISSTQEDKTYYSNILAKSKISLEDAIVDSKEKQLDLQTAQADADSILKQTQTAQLNRYKNIEDAQARVNAAIEQATDSTVKLSIQYKQYGKDVNAIADAQLASGGVLQQFNQMVADKARKEFEDTYKARVKGSKDISKISKDEYDLQFKKETLENSLSKAAESRSKILDRIAKQGGVRTKLDEEELNIVEDIVRESKVQLVGLDESIKKLAVVEKYQKHIHHELEKQNIAKHAANEITAGFTNLLGGAGEELLNIGHAIKESMVSPLALVGALVGTALEEFMKLGEANTAFMESSKLNAEQINHLSHFAHDLSLEYRAQGLEYKDVLHSAGALVDKFGSMNRASDVAIEKVSLLGKAFGISADNAASVVAQVQRSTGASAETAGNIAALGANFAKAAGVAPDAVMADIANSSEEIAKYFKGTPKDLFRTAVEARRLGLDLKGVAKISEKLLDFESSIENQMTASVLLGRQINLDKARELAMQGKIEQAAEETLKQVGSLADFNKMNAVQKQAIADAAGVSVGELQKSLEAQEALSNMTSEQRAEYEKGLKALNAGTEDAGERLLIEQRNQITQQKIADAVAKISEIFANVILPVIEPIFTGLLKVFNIVEPLLPIVKKIVQALLLVKAATLAWQGSLRLISFVGAKKELLSFGGILKGIKAGTLGLWSGFKNITGITSAMQATKAFSATKAADSVITNANTTSVLTNSAALNGKKAADLAVKSAALGKLTVVRADTLQSQLNTKAQVSNAAAGSKLGKMLSSVGNALKLNTLFKTKDTVETNLNTGAQTKNALANSSIGKIIGRLGSVFRISSAAKKADMLATNLNTGAQAASIGPTAAAGTAAGGASLGWAALGISIAAVGFSIAAVIYSISSLATAFKDLNPEQISAVKDVLLGLGIGLITFTGILAALVFSGVLPAAAGGLLAFGGALALIGVGVALTAFGIQMLAAAFKEMPAENISNLGIALFSLAAGLGAIAIASIGFVITLPAILAMTGALMLLTPIFDELGTAIAKLSGGFASLMTSIKSMPAAELFASAAGFISLAGALGIFTLASVGILITIPAISALTGVLTLLGPILLMVGSGVTSIASGFQILVTSINQLNPEILTAMSGAFFDMSLALGALTLALITTAALAPAAVTLGLLLGTLGASAILVGVGLKLAEGAIVSITESLINLVTNVSGNVLKSMSNGLFSLAGGIGTLALASVGFLIAIPAVAALTVALGVLAPVLTILGTGIQSVITGFKSLVASINQLNPEILSSMASAFFDMSIALGTLTLAIIATAALAPAATLLAGVLGTLGVSALLVGTGLKLAEGAITSITDSLINLVTNVSGNVLKSMSDGLFSLAGSVGTLALASIGFLVAIPAVGALTIALGTLGPVLMVLNMGIQSVITGFQNLVASIKRLKPEILSSMASAFFDMSLALGSLTIAIVATAALAPAALVLSGVLITLGASAIMVGIGLQIAEGAIVGITDSLIRLVTSISPDSFSAIKSGLFDLALGMGSLSLAALSVYPVIPALAILTGAMALLGPVLKVVSDGVNYISVGFQNFANAVKRLNPETLWSIAAAFGSVALALGTLSAAIIIASFNIPSIVLLSGMLLSLGTSSLLLGLGVKMAGSGLTEMATAINSIPMDSFNQLGPALISTAAGLGAIAIASIGFVLALPAILTMTGALAILGTELYSLTGSLDVIGDKFQIFAESIKTISGSDILGISIGFISLAGSLTTVGIAMGSIGITLPILIGFTGILGLLVPILSNLGQGISSIASGVQSLINSLNQLNPETMQSIAAAFGSVALALGTLSVAIVATSVFAPAVVLLAGVMMTLGASAIMVGVGLRLASTAIKSITDSLILMTSSINPSILDAMKFGLFSLAEGIGAVGLAAIGFTLAIPSVTLFSLLMATLGSNLLSVGAGMISITSNLNSFITSVNTLLPMLDQINLLTIAFSDLAASIGEVGIASLIAFPALTALSGITSLVSGLFEKEEKSVETVIPAPTAITSAAPSVTTATTVPAPVETAPATIETPSIDISGLVAKIDSLISAVNSQPIQLVVNGKVLAEVVGRNTARSGAISNK